MSDRDPPDRPQQEPQQSAVKLDPIRGIPGSTLVRTIPAVQQTRFMMTPVQSSTALISSTTTIQAQVLPKVTVAAGTASRLSTLPLQVTASTTGYHVPRGAAAVANIAVPRASVATPIVRAPPTLQTIGVAPPHTLAGGNPLVGRSVVGVSPWVTTIPTNPQSNVSRQPQASQIRPPVVATKVVANQIRPMPENQARPVLLHSTTTKQVTLTQQAQVQVSGDKAVLKSYSGANQGTRMVNPASAPPLSRITTSLPPMVSLHPAVLVPNNASIPIKATATPAKVIPQQTHGTTTMQFTPVPASSVQSALAINTVVTRPGLFTVMLASGGPVTASSTNLANISASSAASVPTPLSRPSQTKSFQESTTSSSGFIHTQSTGKPIQPTLLAREQRPPAKDDSGNIAAPNTMVNLPNTVYSIPGGPYYESYQMNLSSRPTTTTSLGSAITTTQVRPLSNQTPQVSTNQNIRSVMVVDSGRTHPFLTVGEGGSVQTAAEASAVSTLMLSAGLSHSLSSKPNTSPRPSILRKRDPEGSPLKAQKNLTPVLSGLTVSAGSPPGPGSPKRPESGNSGQSSAGSTTISANSSPGESPTIVKTEPGEEEQQPPPRPVQPTLTPAPHIVEMSPRKKPRKQQLTGTQITEPAFSEDEMEFISEDKIKKEIKEEPTYEDEKSVAKKNMSLLSTYRHPWKVRNNHFVRYSDVKSKEDRKPTLNELANQKQVLQKLDGWKIYHLGTQIEDMVNSESEFFGLYTSLLGVLESKQKKSKNKDLEKEIHRVNERIRANFQRSKVVKDQMTEAKSQVLKLFEHKGYVADIINRNATKRPLKKRERL